MSDLLTYHPPIIAMRAAWFNELAGQEANYFPSIIGGNTWNAPPTKASNLKNWKWVRHGVLTWKANTIVNLAVLQQGTPWLAAVQPTSWTVDNPNLCKLYTPAQYGKTSIYGDSQMIAVLSPNLAVPDPSDPNIKGNVGRAVLLTGTYADGSTIVEELILYPHPADPLS